MLLAVSLTAQSTTVQNDEDASFFFTVVRRDGPRYELLTGSLGGAIEVLRVTRELENSVPPLGASPQLIGANDAYLVGVFVYPERSAYPVVVVPLPADVATIVVSREQLLVDANAQIVAVRPWQVNLGSEPIVLDNRYLDWEPVLPLVRFARPRAPGQFILETSDGRESAHIQRALFWRRGGTALDTLKAIAGEKALYLKMSTHNELSSGMSLLLFIYGGSGERRARYTIETPVTGRSGWVLLWTDGVAVPSVVGNYVADTFLLEAQLRYDLLPASVAGLPLQQSFVDVATMFSGAGRHEEFYHARVYLSSIPGL